jgi:hypothetical protein
MSGFAFSRRKPLGWGRFTGGPEDRGRWIGPFGTARSEERKPSGPTGAGNATPCKARNPMHSFGRVLRPVAPEAPKPGSLPSPADGRYLHGAYSTPRGTKSQKFRNKWPPGIYEIAHMAEGKTPPAR